MDLTTTSLLIAVLILETLSHLSLKAAASRAQSASVHQHTLAMLRQPFLWIAIATFVALFLCWLAFIARVQLAKGIMLGSITIVGVMIGGKLCFGETITTPRLAAVSLIALGVVLVGWGG